MADYKGAVKCDRSSLIQLNSTCFANMTDVSQLEAAEASAPAFHGAVLRGIKAAGKVRDDQVIARVTSEYAPRPKKRFGVGARVKDIEQGRKGTIIHASAGYTKKKHTPVHRVADKNGRTWLAKQTDLELIY